MAEVSDGVFVTKAGDEAFEADEEVGGSVHVLRDDADVQAGVWAAPEAPAEGTAFEFPHHETVYVLDGEVEIEIEGGPTLNLGPGDMASFRKGVRSTWRPQPGFKEFWVYG